MPDDVRVVLYESEIRRLAVDPLVVEALLDAGQDLADQAYFKAPKRSGEGAASIRPEYVLDGDSSEVRVSWDREHYYMGMQQTGTRFLPAHPFMQGPLTYG